MLHSLLKIFFISPTPGTTFFIFSSLLFSLLTFSLAVFNALFNSLIIFQFNLHSRISAVFISFKNWSILIVYYFSFLNPYFICLNILSVVIIFSVSDISHV